LGAFTRANSDAYVIPTQLPWTAFAQQAPPDPDIEGWQLAPLTEAEIAGIIVGRRAEGPNGSRSPLAGAAFIRSPNGTTINGGLCGSGASSTLMVQNGSVRAGAAVGFVRLRLLVGVVAGVLGSLDRAPRVTAQAN
jgi:hypothetical protein